jgi:hypothetical protein
MSNAFATESSHRHLLQGCYSQMVKLSNQVNPHRPAVNRLRHSLLYWALLFKFNQMLVPIF